jgi:CHAT domain-containing protein
MFIQSYMHAQCLAESDMRKRLDFGRNANLSPSAVLAELLPYLSNINDCPYKNDSTHVYLLRRIAVEYSLIGDYQTAVEYEQQALGIMRANMGKPSINPGDQVNIYFYLSIFYDSLNKVREKQAAVDSCVSIGIRLKHTNSALIRMLASLAQYNYDVGDYHRCIENATVCEKLASEFAKSTLPEDHTFGIDLSSHSLGWRVKALMELKDYAEAEHLITDKLEQYKKMGLIDYMGLIYAQKAELEMHKGNYQEALLFLTRSFSCDRKLGNYLNCKQTLKDIGYRIYYENLDDSDSAMFYYRKALGYTGMDKLEHNKDASESLDIFTDIAKVFVRKELYDSAFFYFQRALDEIKPGANEMDILRLPPEKLISIRKIHYLTGLMTDKGDACLNKYLKTGDANDLRKSIHIYKVTDSLLDRIKVEQIEIESKLFWRESTRRMYEHAINACYLAGDREEAFYFFEKSRAVILNDLLTEQNLQTDKDIKELSQAKKNISVLEREIRHINDTSVASDKLQKELLDKRFQLDKLEEAVKRKNPLYYQSFLDPNLTTLNDVNKKLLNDHEAILEIFEGDSAVFSLLITRLHIYFNKIDKNDFAKSARIYNSFLSNADLLNSHVIEFKYIAQHLYELIFNNNIVPTGRIIISPDATHFPFESLVTDIAKPESYFLQDHAVSYSYSARYLMNDFSNKENKSDGSFLGIAPIHYIRTTSLDPLLGSDISLKLLEPYFKVANSLIESEASKNNFLEQFSKYDVIQLYTHASDSSDRKEPVIYFSDSSLYLSELIQENKPSTRLIVLSACNTGNGKLYQGEGIFSFNRAFATVGIPASVINLWSIDSKSTYRLTELFYKYLSKGLTTDKALQSAKLEFIRNADKQQTLPYYWAPAILIGKTELIDFHPVVYLKTWIDTGIIILILLTIWWLWRKRHNMKRSLPSTVSNSQSILSKSAFGE